MKKAYSGLNLSCVRFDSKARIVTTQSSDCMAIVTLTMQNYICVDPDWQKQVEYIGDQS